MKNLLSLKYVLPLFLLPAFLASCTITPARNEYMTADTDPIEVGTVIAGTPGMFTSQIRQVEILLVYYPRTDTVAFQFPYQTVTYRQYWDTASRQALISAVSRYLDGFDTRNLPVMSRSKMRRAYGSLQFVIEWGSIKSMLSSQGSPRVELGYAFNKESPYFVITQRETKNILSTGNDHLTSLKLDIFFTRKMAEDLAAAIDQQRLLSVLPAPGAPAPAIRTNGEITPDEY